MYDTRHVVYRPTKLTQEELKRGYDWAYREFYRWSNIFEAASAHESVKHRLKHFVYSSGWKKFERAWDVVIRLKQLSQLRPLLEAILSPVKKPKGTPATQEFLPRSIQAPLLTELPIETNESRA